jgi:arabinose-5-phosphate isomerase
VAINATLSAGLLEMTQKGLGLTAIIDADNKPIGIFTDGDLRRTFAKGIYTNSARIADVMHAHPNTINANLLAVEAVEMMEQKKINGLLVVDDTGKLVGAFNMHDLLKAKII